MPPDAPSAAHASSLSVPIAIVIAALIIGASIYFVAGPSNSNDTNAQQVSIPPVTASDHILGDPNAPIKIVEYVDLDCPFCKQLHATMKQVMVEYGAQGQVAWVMRNFPLAELHPNAPKLAEASECIAELGGNDAYWKFIDILFAASPGNDKADMTRLPAFALQAGVPSSTFTACLDSGKYKTKVAAEFKDATNTGAQGTPHSIIQSAGGVDVPLPGSQPYATIKSIIDTLITSLPAATN
jgi:protein-disulfide isomerase